MLALDIGIKHLAYCCANAEIANLDLSGNTKVPHIKHWALVNLQDLNDTPKSLVICVRSLQRLGLLKA